MKTRVWAFRREKQSYPNKALLTPTCSADGDLPLSPLSRQPHPAVSLPLRHLRASFFFINNSCLAAPTNERSSSVRMPVLPSAFVLVGFDPASVTPPVETRTLAMARLNAWIVSVMDLLRQKSPAKADGRRATPTLLESFFAQRPPNAWKKYVNSTSTGIPRISKVVPKAISLTFPKKVSPTSHAGPNASCFSLLCQKPF